MPKGGWNNLPSGNAYLTTDKLSNDVVYRSPEEASTLLCAPAIYLLTAIIQYNNPAPKFSQIFSLIDPQDSRVQYLQIRELPLCLVCYRLLHALLFPPCLVSVFIAPWPRAHRARRFSCT